MAATVQERFREHVGVVEALRANYSSKDDLKSVHAVQQLEIELSELCSRRETDVQAVVKGTILQNISECSFTQSLSGLALLPNGSMIVTHVDTQSFAGRPLLLRPFFRKRTHLQCMRAECST